MTHSDKRPDIDTLRQDTDAELLWQAAARAESLLEVLAAHQPVQAPLSSLLTYLRQVVLVRIGEEERTTLPSLREAGAPAAEIDRLHRDHLALREAIDELAQTTGAPDEPAAERLTSVVRRLIVRLDEHLHGEAAVLSTLPGGYEPNATGWAAAEHWYPLTEGPSIDFELLHPDHAEDAVLTRLTQLPSGEHVQLRSPHRLENLYHRLQRRDPGGYTWAEDGDAHQGWTVTVARRRTT